MNEKIKVLILRLGGNLPHRETPKCCCNCPAIDKEKQYTDGTSCGLEKFIDKTKIMLVEEKPIPFCEQENLIDLNLLESILNYTINYIIEDRVK